MTKYAIIGNGGFGTAIALVLRDQGIETVQWGHDAHYVDRVLAKRENVKYLPGVTLPKDYIITSDVEEALTGAAVIVNAVPTQHVRSVFEGIAPHVKSRVPVLSLSKGIEVKTLLRPSQVLRELLPSSSVAVLSGPSHAEEIARKMPATVVIGGHSHLLARKLQNALSTERFRVYTNTDPIGVELAGALKNIIAIAAGICDGLGFGDNTKAALVTRGLVEVTRLAKRLGARERTFAGLAGMGDLIATAFSSHGRNRAVGEKVGKGMPLKRILADMDGVAEGVATTRSTLALARRHRVDMPIVREVHDILFEAKDPQDALTALMTRSTKTEI